MHCTNVRILFTTIYWKVHMFWAHLHKLILCLTNYADLTKPQTNVSTDRPWKFAIFKSYEIKIHRPGISKNSSFGFMEQNPKEIH